MDEIKGKWQVFLVDSCGEKQDAISAATSFYGAMALIRGYLQRCEYADFVGGMMPVPFLVDVVARPAPTFMVDPCLDPIEIVNRKLSSEL